VGQPVRKLSSRQSEVWLFQGGERTWKVEFSQGSRSVLRVVEALPGNAEMIVVQ
jgi:hypothetical protein